ncbi:13408_t:CDS:10 [Ambispora gerdemannii]|uniref:13408_t:CDS:1 n=1 Tax=Ambispora gerdemannii TaxID=144530 RepID=A0A9N8Z5F2_9GLOM|nr:13408_t:CDS:10 [Ambispora gerdemannii]
MPRKKSQYSPRELSANRCGLDLKFPNPTPSEFFRMIHPTHRGSATCKYRNAFKTALNQSQDVGRKTELERMKIGEETIQWDWEQWIEEKKAIKFRQKNHDTNIKIQKKFFSLVEKKENVNVNEIAERKEEDDSEEEAEDNGMEEKAEDSLAIASSGTSNNAPEDEKEGQGNDEENLDRDENANNNANGDYVERVEQDTQDTLDHQKQWILSSGTDVAAVLKQYAQTIPETQKCLNPIYWGILDLTSEHVETKSLFTAADWKEMVDNFNKEVKLSETIAPDIVYHLFDTIVNSGKGNVGEIDRISVESIQREASKLSRDDEDEFIAVKRALLTYAENLADIDLPMSEMTFDNLFTNMLARRFLDKKELKMDVGEICCWASAQRRNEGRSVVLRARIGQRCDFRGTLKNNIDKLEAIIGLRSGGLPTVHRKKIFEDRTDLMVAMRDILYTFFVANPNATDEKLHQTFVLGIQSWGWTQDIYGMDCKGTKICRFGRLRRIKLQNTICTISCLEELYTAISDVKVTLKSICDHTNSVALANAQARRRKKRKDNKDDSVGGYFGTVTGTPTKKKRSDVIGFEL